MPNMPNAQTLYTERKRAYALWTAFFRQEQAIGALLNRADILRPNLRILDAGCGSGAATFALVSELRKRGCRYGSIDAFDLTQPMLEMFRARLEEEHVSAVRLREANVLNLDTDLPESWMSYDLIVAISVLEYVPPDQLSSALAALRRRLAPDGTLVAVITRKNPISTLMIEWAWSAHAFTAYELRTAFRNAGLTAIQFRRFPLGYFWMNMTNHVVVAHACQKTLRACNGAGRGSDAV
jgi:ubiquinone/menaquinone biosynthesis C-methylase UbiE